MELLLGNIIAQANYSVLKLEASMSTDLRANYHNMHKVCHCSSLVEVILFSFFYFCEVILWIAL